MKINRQSDLTENYNITCDWLDEFANSIAKEANLEYLDGGDRTRILDNARRFRTIDAKMADIKSRIGFDLLAEYRNEEPKVASQNCGCEKVASCVCKIKTAKAEHSESDIKAMSQILSYIKDLSDHEPHLDVPTVLDRCRKEPGLRFVDLPINLKKLQEWIGTLVSDDEEYDVKYVPPEPIASGDAEDNRAEYYQHAEPTV